MTDPVTTNLGLTLPTVGADSGTWGTLNNGNYTIIDTAFVSGGHIEPAALSTGAPTWDTSGNLTAGATLYADAGDMRFGAISSTLRVMNFSVIANIGWQCNTVNGVVTLFYNNAPVLSIDSLGNVIAKGTIAASGTPAT